MVGIIIVSPALLPTMLVWLPYLLGLLAIGSLCFTLLLVGLALLQESLRNEDFILSGHGPAGQMMLDSVVVQMMIQEEKCS